jgi:hypothetical protein
VKTLLPREAVLRPCLWLSLGAWAGALALFGFAVAPAALRIAPSPIAGDLVKSVLGALNGAGVVAGTAVAALASLLQRGRLAIFLPLTLVMLCAASQLLVTPAIEQARHAADPEVAARFGHLHGISVGLYAATFLGVIVLSAWHAHQEYKSGDFTSK